jgi:CxxC-x17-CxxC domain-containing protein
MGNFNREDKGSFRSGGRNGEREGGRSGGFQKRSFGGSDRGNKEQMMHQAVCSECHKKCEVPFRPTTGKPVYCKDCFGNKGNRNEGGRNENSYSKTECDRVPAKIHYENKGGSDEGVKRQLTEVSIKLDRLIKAMESFTGTGVKSASFDVPKEEKKIVDVVGLKKALDKATEKEAVKVKAVVKETKALSKKAVKKTASPKKKK